MCGPRMICAPQKTHLEVQKWELKKGFRGILCGNTIRRLCRVCDSRPTRTLAESVCQHCHVSNDVPVEGVAQCQSPGCHRVASHGRATLCLYCWVKEDPLTRGCPGCGRKAKSLSRPDGLCQNCTRRIARGRKPVNEYGVSDLFGC